MHNATTKEIKAHSNEGTKQSIAEVVDQAA